MTDLRIIFTLAMIALLACCCANVKAAHPLASDYGIELAPGEVLVAVNGISVTEYRPLFAPAPVRKIAQAAVITFDRLQEALPILDRQAIRATRQCTRDARGVMRCGL